MSFCLIPCCRCRAVDGWQEALPATDRCDKASLPTSLHKLLHVRRYFAVACFERVHKTRRFIDRNIQLLSQTFGTDAIQHTVANLEKAQETDQAHSHCFLFQNRSSTFNLCDSIAHCVMYRAYTARWIEIFFRITFSSRQTNLIHSAKCWLPKKVGI